MVSQYLTFISVQNYAASKKIIYEAKNNSLLDQNFAGKEKYSNIFPVNGKTHQGKCFVAA